MYFIQLEGKAFFHIYLICSYIRGRCPNVCPHESKTSGALLPATARNICPEHIQERESVPLSDPCRRPCVLSLFNWPLRLWQTDYVNRTFLVHYFSSAVFGSYLRPDLVPANHSYYDGSSVGTISNSSVFVNVDNQTEDRYDSSLPFAPPLVPLPDI